MPDSAFSKSRQPVLDLSNLRVSFGNGPATVDGVDIVIGPGEIVCLVGVSGSGKSLTGLALMRLTPPEAIVVADRWLFEGEDLTDATAADMARLRGHRMAMVFQDPLQALNPLMTIGDQIVEVIQAHQPMSPTAARGAALALLDDVSLAGGAERFTLYPHQMSGGMRQRALIAMALAGRPRLLIADEPTSALDAVVQREIITLIDRLRRDHELAALLITHNLAHVEEIADSVSVMRAGTIVERGSREDIFSDPQHPYTLELLAAAFGIPAISAQAGIMRKPPAFSGRATNGCGFVAHCPLAADICANRRPILSRLTGSHEVACWRAPIAKPNA
jgi:oligopeptide/dipeptide ABC transporter ATP-binding protein